MAEYIATNGIPKRIRTDPGTAFKSEKFKQFCERYFIEHIISPVRDHRENGKVERMIRTTNERLRTNKKIVVERERSQLSKILFALRSEKGVDGKSAFEKHMGRKPNTLKSAMIGKCILDKDPRIEIEPEDFSEEADSTILVRERVRGKKLEGAFEKVKGNIINETENTLKILPKTGKSFTVSKRDVAKTPAKDETTTKEKEDKERKNANGDQSATLVVYVRSRKSAKSQQFLATRNGRTKKRKNRLTRTSKREGRK